MPDLSGAWASEEEELEDQAKQGQIDQSVEGDRNQVIGQVLGGMVVYVSGGQPIIHAPSESSEASEAAKQSKLGPNPYKGLLAFQETDGDRFFGRDVQIKQLWQQFRDLPTVESGVRLLPIYGPSGSGKSSLARAGLIPALEKRPLPGRAQARVAVVVPGVRPVEALATVLARIVTNDPSPVAKTQEFRDALLRVSQRSATEGREQDKYDGLRRIADALPNIATSPLIVPVDQLEEIYTLCKDAEERKAFVQNLLCAASDSANHVSVIVTMRSDFLGETQKYPALNRLFSVQGFLAPVMNKAEVREAISKPAELAGYPLDERTIDRLVYGTEDREGALPLLQFALSQIWEGVEKGISTADTLEELGGVGGALAEKAERVYAGLQPAQQLIARRIFTGLVQLGEGTRDTRRRVEVERLVSRKDDPAVVRQVLGKFTNPANRLITCAATEDGTETAEVTHEALFDHWVRLQDWLGESRSELRFQRRLEIAAAEWDEMGRPEGKLWRSPDLDILRQYAERSGDEMTPLEMAFFTTSEQTIEKAEKERKRQRRLLVRVLSVGLTLTTGAAIFATYQVQRFERQRVNQLATTSAALLLSDERVDATIYAIAASGASKSAFVRFLRPLPSHSVYASLLDAKRTNSEQNQLKEHMSDVTSVAFSLDGKKLVSGGEDSTVRLWNAITGESIGNPLIGHEDVVNSVAFSPDGKKLVSGSGWMTMGSGKDNTVRIWDAITGEPIGNPLTGHESDVNSVAFSPDSERLVSGSDDKTIRIWDATTGEPIGSPLIHESNVVSVDRKSDEDRKNV